METDPLQLLRGENWLIRRLLRRRMEGELLPRDQVHDLLTRLALSLRDAGEKLKRQCGAEPHGILADTLSSWELEINAFFDDHDQPAEDDLPNQGKPPPRKPRKK